MTRQASFPILLLIGPVLAFAIKGFAPILALAGLTAILSLSVRRPLPRAPWRDVPAVLFVAFGYVLVSATWGISERTFDTVVRLVLVVVFTWALIAAFNILEDNQKMRWARWLRLSVGFGVFASVIIGPYNIYWPSAVEFMEAYFELMRQVNNSLSILPAFLFILLSSWQKQHRWILALIIVVAFCVTFISESQTSFLATVLALIAFALAKISVPLCRHLVFASLAVCTLASPLIFSAAYQGKWVASYAPQTFAERGAGEVREWIYYVYAQEIANRPLFGHGINGSKDFKPSNLGQYVALTNDAPALHDEIQKATQSGNVAAHPHNIFLQLIFEFGYVGSLLILAAIWRFFSWLENYADAHLAPYYWASFSAGLATVMFGLTLWHSWLMTAIACLVLFTHMSAELGRRTA